MDRRIQRTRNNLTQAMRALMSQYRWEQINVQLLCDQADVSRSAFYTHFDNKAQLLDLCFEQLEQELLVPVTARGIDSHGTLAFLPNLLNHVEGHCEVMTKNLSAPAGLVILNRFKAVIKAMTEREFKQCKRQKPKADQLVFIAGGIFALLEQWHLEQCRTPVKTLTRRIDALVAVTID